VKTTFLICCILALALLGSSCAPEAALEVSVSDDTISLTATLVESGVIIENAGDVTCLVFVSWAKGEHRFELPVGERITVTDTSQPIEVSAVTL